MEFFSCRASCEKNRVPPILCNFIERGTSFVKPKGPFVSFRQGCRHYLSWDQSRSFHGYFKDRAVRLGVFEMDAKHAEHLQATVAVEAMWWEQESRDVMYRIANGSILGFRDEVCRIANALRRTERSEFLEPVEF